MLRHISIFTLKDKNDKWRLIDLLNEVGESCPLIVYHQVGTNITNISLDQEGPDFGDVIQIIDFHTLADLQAYPTSKEHLKLFHEGPEMVKVTAIDFEWN